LPVSLWRLFHGGQMLHAIRFQNTEYKTQNAKRNRPSKIAPCIILLATNPKMLKSKVITFRYGANLINHFLGNGLNTDWRRDE
jgi:hypothetical protein